LHDHVGAFSELKEECEIFRDDVAPDAEAAEVLANESSRRVLRAVVDVLDSRDGSESETEPASSRRGNERGTPGLSPQDFKVAVKEAGKAVGVKGKDLFFPVRAALTGNLHGPDLSRIAAIKGRRVVRGQLQRAATKGLD
jgi:glutamyl/glutaminyl-tRNA synthetase